MRGRKEKINYKLRAGARLPIGSRSEFGIICLLLTTATMLPAQTEQFYAHQPKFATLVNFNGANGADPQPSADLVRGPGGSLYGTTYEGGKYNGGTVFEVTPAGRLTTLYDFCSQPNCTDGTNPVAGLLLAKDGDFYGVTYFGGSDFGGTVFKITQSGTLTTLYSFTFAALPFGFGAYPSGGLIQASDGNLYGTTEIGGGTDCLGEGCGTVFKITPSGTLTTLASFDEANGATPVGALIEASGNFYGVTYFGGSENNGTVFKMTPTGTLTTLHSFSGTDGAKPAAGLVRANDGNFYGTTSEGGSDDDGTVFKITPKGELTTLHSFNLTQGSYPSASLVQAADGKLYGTTEEGGAKAHGIIFKITLSGTLATVYTFNSTEGFGNSGLTKATWDTFYGTTYPDNSSSGGTIFKLTLELCP